MLKFTFGLFLLFGAVFTIDNDLSANMTLQLLLCFGALALMYYGSKEIE